MTGLSPTQLAQRRLGIGASEVGAVLGLHPYQTPLDVYLDKRGLVEPFAGNAYTRWGLKFEALIAEAYTEEAGDGLLYIPPPAGYHPGPSRARLGPLHPRLPGLPHGRDGTPLATLRRRSRAGVQEPRRLDPGGLG